jgi:phage terminase large subunit-like protein
LELAFRHGANGALNDRVVTLSEPKKSGKTFMAAYLGLWWAVITPQTEIIVSANDREQAESRVFQTMKDLIEHNPSLDAEAEVYARSIVFNNGTVITAISSDYKGAAGSRHSLAIFDELWGFESDSARRLYEELTPPPTEFSAWILVVTYAGFTNESDLLESIYKRGLAGRRIDAELECYEAEELFIFWSHTHRQPWQIGEEGEAYYASQRKILRPEQFQRLHFNEWVSSENRFIDATTYDACVEHYLWPDPTGSLFIGIDASVKRDCTAVVRVKYSEFDDRLVLADYKIWRPGPGGINLEASIEFYLRRLYGEFPRTEILKVFYDPFQMMRTAQLLREAGLPCEELSQTEGHLTEATETLLSAFINRNLRLCHAPDLREHCLNVVSVESSRGVRLAKEKQSSKIDGCVALSFAVLATIQHGKPPSLSEYGEFKVYDQFNLVTGETIEEAKVYKFSR